MENQILSLIQKRRSHRAYSEQQLSSEQLEALMSAALYSPSASNRQPWHFTFTQNKTLLNNISRAAHKQTRLIAQAERSERFADDNFDVFYHAPTVVVISSSEGRFTLIDCGIAVQNIALAAEGLGLGSVIVGLAALAFAGEDKDTLEKALSFPPEHHFAIAIALGYPLDDKPAHPLNQDKITLID